MNGRGVLVTCLAAAAICGAVPGTASAASDTLTATCTAGGQSQQCTSGWYTGPVSVVWDVSSPLSSPPSGCQLDVAVVYGTDRVVPLSCSVTWSDTGQTSVVAFPLHVEVSTPTATTTPDRPADANGWYNHPITATTAGTAFSGIASCTAPQTYAGPATTGSALAGTCTDNAGKVAGASFSFRYDAIPPTLRVTSQPADHLAGLRWHASSAPAPLGPIQITRRPGLKHAPSSVLHAGAARTYQDHQVRNGITYTYTITATDQAGNVTQRVIRVTPGIRLLSPGPNARLSAPPTLRWTEIPAASYYNVQLFRGSKILSAWPRHASLRLSRSWRFAGRRHRLVPGRYHWYVWPGYGPQRDARYGKAIGNATFAVR